MMVRTRSVLAGSLGSRLWRTARAGLTVALGVVALALGSALLFAP
ncbi:MAG TPA: hypothetical protein VKI44_11060 [Acetobacteraceae bacterium]|nr:hypothetical protein [Acetobacteraceae bacterium]